MTSTKVCTVEGCEKQVLARGLCQPHYRRQRESQSAPCSVNDCDRGALHRGWCGKHYTQWQKHGDPLYEPQPRNRERVECAVEGCSTIERTAGWCGKHYARWRKYGDATKAPKLQRAIAEDSDQVCTISGCARRVLARGVCGMHYQRARRGDSSIRLGEPKTPERQSRRGGPCSIEGCAKPVRYRTWCGMHYQRWRLHGDTAHRRFVPSNCITCGAEKHVNANGKIYCKPCASRIRKEWRKVNLGHVRAIAAAYYQSNKEQHALRHRAYYQLNRETILQQTADYSRAHPEIRRAAARRWVLNNPERTTLYTARRRALKLEAVCEHGIQCVPAHAYKLIRGQRCTYCDAPAEHADHFIPLARGGLHCRDNIVPACPPCNFRKNDTMPDEWLAERAKQA